MLNSRKAVLKLAVAAITLLSCSLTLLAVPGSCQMPTGGRLGRNQARHFFRGMTSIGRSVSRALPRHAADINGDGRDDLIGLGGDGSIWYTTDLSHWNRVPGAVSQLAVGDVSGDGKADIVGLDNDGSIWYTTNESTWNKVPGKVDIIAVLDLNGDGNGEIVGAESLGTDSDYFAIWYTTDKTHWTRIPGAVAQCVAGDFDGDGATDIVGLDADGSIWYTTDKLHWTRVPGNLDAICAGNLDGDGKADLFGLGSDSSIWYTTNLSTWHQIPGALDPNSSDLYSADLNGDGIDEIIGYDYSDGSIWYTANKSTWQEISGALAGAVVIGDFNGDVRDDIAGLDWDGSIWYTTNKTSWAQISGSLAGLYSAKYSAEVNVVADDSSYGGEMIYIPAGSFLMGNNGSEPYSYSDELPQHSVFLSGYYIGKYEVTRGEYRAFMNAGGYSNSAYWSNVGWTWKLGYNRTEPCYWAANQDWCGDQPFTQTDNHPVVGVSYYEAEAFCNWAGGHLPTEAQWEKAARWNGSSALVYPWGNTWDDQKCNHLCDHNLAGGGYGRWQTAPVGSYPSGASPYGCQDMAGNVWEWCQDWYKSYPGSSSPFDYSESYRVLRGGGWDSDDHSCRCAYRYYYFRPYDSWYSYGFRLAR